MSQWMQKSNNNRNSIFQKVFFLFYSPKVLKDMISSLMFIVCGKRRRKGFSLNLGLFKVLYFIMIFLFCYSGMTTKQSIITLLLFFALISSTASTVVTFYVDHEVDQPLDYVQINAIIKVGRDSLDEAIQEAANTIGQIQALIDDYCKTYTPKDKQKDQCKDLVQASRYSIKPQYELLKKQQLFGGFVVAHQIIINVKQSESFGKLVDDILKIGVSKINSLEWKPKQEADGQEIAVEEGLQQAQQVCKKLGSVLSKIVSVQQVTDFGVDEQQEEEQGSEEGDDGQGQQEEQEEQEEQEQPANIKEGFVYYKFVVECARAKKGK